jgi:hypothetical protein
VLAPTVAAGELPTVPPTLSKSDFKLARTCATKLYYRELKYPDTLQDNEYLQLLAEGGYMVEQLAKQKFPGGITLDYAQRPAHETAAETIVHLERGATSRVTLFEATLLEGVRQARVDILVRTPQGFELYEVKSSSISAEDAEKRLAKTGSAFRSLRAPHGIATDWREYLEDVTFQCTILKDLFPGVPIRAHLILTDKDQPAEWDAMPSWFRIVRGADGRLHTAEFIGDAEKARTTKLVRSFDVSAEVAELEPIVRDESERFAASLVPVLRKIEPSVTKACRDCEFRVAADEPRNGFLECWGDRGRAAPHVLGLYQGRDLLEDLIARGIDRLVDIPDDIMATRTGTYAARQRTQLEYTRRNTQFVDESLGGDLSLARWPLHFIDFEAARLAIPHHQGMTPYGLIAFQWSCHTQREPGGRFEHAEFLNLDPTWPNEAFARSLRAHVGDTGTLLVWSAFEKSVLTQVAEELSALGSGDLGLAEWLRAASLQLSPDGGRQLDLLKLCRAKFFHPLMEGSNSIKRVLDAIWKESEHVRARFAEFESRAVGREEDPYASLPPLTINGEVQQVIEGTGAVNAYFAMVYGVERDDANARKAWSELLLQYCRLDTLAMVLIWEHWRRITAPR